MNNETRKLYGIEEKPKSDYDFYNNLWNNHLFKIRHPDFSLGTGPEFNEGGDDTFLAFGKNKNTEIYDSIKNSLNDIANQNKLSYSINEVHGWNDGENPIKAYKIRFKRN